MTGHRQYKVTDYRFGLLVVSHREKVGLTQQEIGEALGVSRRTIQHWEAGTTFPDTDHLRKLIAFLLPLGAFARGRERDEAQALWAQADESAARRRSPFDGPWFDGLLRGDGAAPAREPGPLPASNIDWGDAPDVREIHGRDDELAALAEWILDRDARLVAIHGMGGMGKTTLAARFAQTAALQFEYVIWRSLRNAPTLEELLLGCLQILSPVNTARPTVDLLLDLLQRHRCLLVLDNVETLHQPGGLSGEYREGYQEYQALFQRLAQSRHRSCLLLTTRESPAELESLEGARSPVRIMRLAGLAPAPSQSMLADKGLFGPAETWNVFVQYYGGNPLALKIASNTVRDLFGGDLAAFLKDAPVTLHTLQHLLDNQFEQLSALERDVLFWLSIERDDALLETLREDLPGGAAKGALLPALMSLRQRSLIERGEAGAVFHLQPVVLEYVTNRLADRVARELESREMGSLTRYALLKSQAPDYVRDSQARMILVPVLDRLAERLGDRSGLSEHLRSLVGKVRGRSPEAQGYAGGNLVNLLACLNGHIRGEDFSGLVLREVNLQGVDARDADFSGVEFSGSRFTEPLETIGALVLSPSGRHLAASTYSGQIRFWRVADNKPLWTASGVQREWALAFSPDERLLASGGYNGQICLWNAADGSLIRQFDGHRLWVHAVAFDPSGRRLASAGTDGIVRVWDVDTAACLLALAGHTGVLMSVAFSSDGARLVSSGEDGTLRIWDAVSGECLHILRHPASDALVHTALHPGGRWFASCSEDGSSICFWDLVSGESLGGLTPRSATIASIAFDPSGETLACGTVEGGVELWKLQPGTAPQFSRLLLGHQHHVAVLSFAQNGLLATLSNVENIKLWDTHSGRLLRTIQGYSRLIAANAFSPDGKWLVQGDANGMLRFWEADAREYRFLIQGHAGPVWRIVFHPDGRTFATCGEDRVVRLWDLRERKCVRTFAGHTEMLWDLAFSPDGSRLASAGINHWINIWDAAPAGNESALLRIDDIPGQTWSLAFDPAGQLLAGGGENGAIHLWDAHNGQLIRSMRHGADVIGSLRFSSDGRRLYSSSNTELLKCWDVSSGECNGGVALPVAGNRNKAVEIGRDGAFVVTGAREPLACIWRPGRDDPLHVEGHANRVWGIALSPDERLAASSDEQGTTILAEVESGAVVCRMSLDRPYERMRVDGVRGLNLAERAALQALGAVE
jgi:WD40 repeat protein/transcriptional regulator with XRE-family HTH domain